MLHVYTITTSDTIIQKSNRGFISFEVPFLLRKNFSPFLGAGIGASARTTFFNGENKTVRRGIQYKKEINSDIPTLLPFEESLETETISGNTTRFSVFADLTFGSVRSGPNLGIRAGGVLHDGFQPFVQVSLEIKL